MLNPNVFFLGNSKQMWHYNLNKNVRSKPLQQVILLAHHIIDKFSPHLCLSQTVYNSFSFFQGNLHFSCSWVSAMSGWKHIKSGWKDVKIGFKLNRKCLPMAPNSQRALIHKIYFQTKRMISYKLRSASLQPKCYNRLVV